MSWRPTRWLTIPMIMQRGTWRGRDVLLMRDRYARFVDALMICEPGGEVEVYVKYRHRRVVDAG